MDAEKIIEMRKYGKGMKRDGLSWTEEDFQILEEGYWNGTTISHLALALERSESAIIQALAKGNFFRYEVKTRNRTNRGKRCICNKCEGYEFCAYSPKNRDHALATVVCPKEANTDHV